MRVAVWVMFTLMAAFWTGGAWLAAELVQWTAQGLASGGATDVGRAVAEWPLPPWVAAWLGEPGWVYALQDGVAWALKLLAETLPWFGAAVGWLIPLVWTLWGLGFFLMLAMAGGVHLLVGRYQTGPPRAA